MCIAQISDKASDPAAWADLARTIGVGGFFAVLAFVAFVLFCYLIYRATIGPSGFVRTIAADLHARAIAFLDRLASSIDRLEAAAKTDGQAQADARTVGREFAAGMTAIAAKIGADVEKEAATIAATLDRSPS